MALKDLKLWHWVAILGAVWIVTRALRPKWYDDLMLLAFADDQFATPGETPEAQKQFEQAADLAARFVLPYGWVIRVAEVATGTNLEQVIQQLQQNVLAMGPPADTKPETLAAYKNKALASVGVKSRPVAAPTASIKEEPKLSVDTVQVASEVTDVAPIDAPSLSGTELWG